MRYAPRLRYPRPTSNFYIPEFNRNERAGLREIGATAIFFAMLVVFGTIGMGI